HFYLLISATHANCWQNTKGFCFLSKIHFRGNIKLFLILHRFPLMDGTRWGISVVECEEGLS
ncbi:hypothetical protein QUH51_25355, partial [Citrobacter freundii]